MLSVSGPGPFGDDDPFAGMAAMFNQFLGAFGGGGPTISWEHAKQMAGSIANGGDPEANVEPLERIQIEQLARVAELQITEATGLSIPSAGGVVSVEAVTRAQWAAATLDAYRSLFEQLTTSLGDVMREQLDDVDPEDITALGGGMGDEDAAAFLAGLSQMLGPMMLSMMAGSTVGHLGLRAFGAYDLPIPRPANEAVLVVANNLDRFAEDWSIPSDDLRLWICLEEMAHRAVLGVPHVRARISELLSAHAAGFAADPTAIESRLGDVDLEGPGGLDALQNLLSDPDVVLGAIRSPAQEALLPHLDAVVTVVEGYVDHTLDRISERLIASAPQLSEALRRRRVETDQASRFVERLFGLELTQEKLDRGHAFIDGVVSRAGEDALVRLWSADDGLPTPAEVDAPGLWLARVGISSDQPLPEIGDEGFEVPDFPDLDD